MQMKTLNFFLKRPLSSVQCLRSAAFDECHCMPTWPERWQTRYCQWRVQRPPACVNFHSLIPKIILLLSHLHWGCAFFQKGHLKSFIIFRITQNVLHFKSFVFILSEHIKRKMIWFAMQEYIWSSVAEWSVNSMLLYKVLNSLFAPDKAYSGRVNTPTLDCTEWEDGHFDRSFLLVCLLLESWCVF